MPAIRRIRSLIVVFAVACSLTNTGAEPASNSEKSQVWKRVWADEFDHDGAPDPAKWVYEKGYVRNQESQYYTNDRRENVRVDNGKLVIEARKDSLVLPDGKTAKITSGAIETRDRVSWKYGRIEVKAKVPEGRGTWPAIWMMPQDRSAGWPACGEVDIMESVGYEPDLIHQTIHTKSANHVNHKAHGTSTPVKNLGDGFHVYAMEWNAQTMAMFIDDQQCFTFANDGGGADTWPFDKPFYVILNLAIGGTWGAMKGIDDSMFPCRMEVEYVRVYQHE